MSDRQSYGAGGCRWVEERQKWVASQELGADPNTGRRKRVEASGPTEAQARAALRKRIKEINENGGQQTRGGDTVESWMRYWLKHVAPQRIRPNTLRSYTSVSKYQIVPHIGHLKLKKLQPSDIRFMMDAILRHVEIQNAEPDRKRKISGVRRAKYAKTVLRKALGDAVRDGRAPRNVASREWVDKLPVQDKAAKQLSAAQSLSVLRRGEEKFGTWVSRWALALMLAPRQGESLGMQWDRIDFSNMEIFFTKQLQVLQSEHGCGVQLDEHLPYWPCGYVKTSVCPQRQFVLPSDTDSVEILGDGPFALTPPKTQMSKRGLPMPIELARALWAHKVATADQPNPYNLVWHTPEGKPIHYRKDYQEWIDLLDDCGLERIKLHSTRHSAAAILMEMGVDKEVIKDILGHTSINTTAGYTRAGQDFMRTIMDKTGGILGDMFSGVVIDAEVVEGPGDQRKLA